MAHRHFKVVRVVRRSNFDCTCSKIWIYEFVGDDWNHAVYQWQHHFGADHVLITWVIRMDSNCAIAHHRLSTRCCNNDALLAIAISNLNKFTGIIVVFYFNIRERCKATWAPIDDAFSAVDKPLIEELLKDCEYCLRKILIHRKCFARPVNRIAKASHLPKNLSAGFSFPIPDFLDEIFAT